MGIVVVGRDKDEKALVSGSFKQHINMFDSLVLRDGLAYNTYL